MTIIASTPSTPLTTPLSNVSTLANAIKRSRKHLYSTPGLLRLSLSGIWLLAVISAGFASLTLERHRHEMQTIGRDSAPSVIAAQAIKWNIADLHGNLIRQFLVSPEQAADAAGRARQSREAASDGLVTAAQNITYGDAERRPILALQNGLASYDSAAARACVLRGRADPLALENLRNAELLVTTTLNPAAEALAKANQDALDNGYSQERQSSAAATVLLGFSSLAMLGLLVWVQILLQRRTHRRISPALLACLLLSLGWTLKVGSAVYAESRDLKVVKQDAFDSIGAMWRARAEAFDAQAHLCLALLDPASAARAHAAFEEETSRLAALPDGTSFDQIQWAGAGGPIPKGLKGYIADELNNITFDGEQEAADGMLAAFVRYIAVAQQVQQTQEHGDDASAKRLCLGYGNDQASGAMSAFDAALEKVIDINQRQFDLAVERGFADVAGLGYWNLAVMLGVGVLALLAISPRLREYSVQS
jgi:hypothetical protein